MRIAYFSPFNPQKSGVSDYSEELLPHMARYMEIDVYVENCVPTNREIADSFRLCHMNQYQSIIKSRGEYDTNIYHIGNNGACHTNIYRHALQYPGIIVLHDLCIHHMIANMTLDHGKKDEYVAEMAYCHGEKGRAVAEAYLRGEIMMPWESDAMAFPLNKRLVDASRGVIAHSYYVRNSIKRQRIDVPVRRINFHSLEIAEDPIETYKEARKALGIDDREIMIASFGFMNLSKRIDKILAAVAQLCKDGYRFKYFVVGGELGPDMLKFIDEVGIPPGVVNSTGFLNLNEGFLLYMRAADIACNLRYPVHGETSSTLHRLLGMGKPILVSDAGSFKEYPDSAVSKIAVSETEEDEIYTSLKALITDKAKRLAFGEAAYQYARENLAVERTARDYFEFISDVVKNRFRYETLIEQLAHGMAALGLTEADTLLRDISELIAGLS
ncbi:MAG: glycosyltransferase [Acidobacteria bacterium]|nr:glycosyltransferase [Acidobacteriota bacterium]MBI3658178.1 glycosyltransferase [Acidobacteriota bacterium]